VHDNSQLVARYLKVPHETLAYIGGDQGTFDVVRNGVIGFVYGVGTKVCIVSI
jgi:hypothetical protein